MNQQLAELQQEANLQQMPALEQERLLNLGSFLKQSRPLMAATASGGNARMTTVLSDRGDGAFGKDVAEAIEEYRSHMVSLTKYNSVKEQAERLLQENRALKLQQATIQTRVDALEQECREYREQQQLNAEGSTHQIRQLQEALEEGHKQYEEVKGQLRGL